jgi:hypothetical protein
VPRAGRLLHLGTYRLALRSAGLASRAAVLRAAPERRVRLRRCSREIPALVRANDTDVMRALFWPPEPIDRTVAILGTSGRERLLSVGRRWGAVTQEKLLQLVYRANDRVGERWAWRALRGAIETTVPRRRGLWLHSTR